MFMAKAAVNPNQERMFVINQQTGTVHPNLSLVPQPYGDVTAPEAVSNILERNAHLQNTLGHIGLIGRTGGLQVIAETRDRKKLETKYDDVDQVVGKAVEKAGRSEIEAKHEFAKAIGFEALVKSGLMSKEDAKSMAREMYGQFVSTFSGSRNAKAREAEKSWLNYQERTLMGRKTRRPKSPLPKPPKVL